MFIPKLKLNYNILYAKLHEGVEKENTVNNDFGLFCVFLFHMCLTS